jgi:hypothetical protein
VVRSEQWMSGHLLCGKGAGRRVLQGQKGCKTKDRKYHDPLQDNGSLGA